MKQCPACGANNASDQPSCSICGASLSQVADSGAARTLFGMPALKFDQEEEAPEPTPEPAPSPSRGPSTRHGFRALGAVDLEGSMGSVDMRPAAAEIHSTQFGLPAPFRPGASDPPEDAPAAAPDERPSGADLHSTQFGAPSPFKAGQLPPIGTGDPGYTPEPEPEPSLESTRMGMPSVDPTGGQSAAAAKAEQNYRTLVGPPLPLAEAARARDEARKQQQAEAARAPQPAQDNYRTLVGPPAPIAEAARARDEARARARREAAELVAAEQRGGSEAPRGPSVIVDGGLDVPQGQPSVIVDEPVEPETPAARPGQARVAGAGRPPNAVERDLASRVAAAMDTDERTAMVVAVQPRSYKWVVFLLVVVAGIALALWLTRDAHAFQARIEGVDARVDGERLTLTATVVSDRPVKVAPSQSEDAPTFVDGRGAVSIDLPLDDFAPGVHPLALRVSTDQGAVELPLALTVWVRSTTGPVATVGEAVPVELELRPGWRAAAPAEAVDGAASKFALGLDPADALARVDEPGGLTAKMSRDLALEDRAGGQRTFTVEAEVPLPRTPLVITAPARTWRRDADTVVISGRTAPGAVVKAARVDALADDAGAFRIEVPLGGAREQAIEVSADAEGARPTVQRVTVERLTPAAGVAQSAALRARQSERLGTIEAAPRYARWITDREALRGRAIAFTGRLVAVERAPEPVGGQPEADRAVVSTCATGDHCPVWVTTRSPILVAPGQRVSVSGTLAGLETWRAADGFVRAPRVEGALLAP